MAAAALEKFSTPLIKKVRVYGAWIRNPRAYGHDPTAQKEMADWDRKVADEYGFEQGPGATLVFLSPTDGESTRTDAEKLELFAGPFERDGGKTPLLEKELKLFLKKLEAKAAQADGGGR